MRISIHEMRLPRKVVVGEGIIGRLSEIEERIASANRILVASGPHVYEEIGVELMNSWSRGQEVETEFVVEASMDGVERLIEASKASKAEIILGVGGGRVIDVAKMASYKQNLDFVSVPTAASHDGIASQFASLRREKRAYSYTTNPPTSVIVDIDVILKAPKRLTVSGFGDAVSKITAVKDWMLARDKKGEYYGDYSAQLALMAADLVMKNASGIGNWEKESIRTLVEALISDGVASGIAGSSRPCSGSEHLVSHALDSLAPNPALHGEQCGVGTIMMAKLHGLYWERVKRVLESVRAPTTAEELGIEPRYIIEALLQARSIRPRRYTILNEKRLTREDAENLARTTGVIP